LDYEFPDYEFRLVNIFTFKEISWKCGNQKSVLKCSLMVTYKVDWIEIHNPEIRNPNRNPEILPEKLKCSRVGSGLDAVKSVCRHGGWCAAAGSAGRGPARAWHLPRCVLSVARDEKGRGAVGPSSLVEFAGNEILRIGVIIMRLPLRAGRKRAGMADARRVICGCGSISGVVEREIGKLAGGVWRAVCAWIAGCVRTI
jgi:hypothetical protein